MNRSLLLMTLIYHVLCKVTNLNWSDLPTFVGLSYQLVSCYQISCKLLNIQWMESMCQDILSLGLHNDLTPLERVGPSCILFIYLRIKMEGPSWTRQGPINFSDEFARAAGLDENQDGRPRTFSFVRYVRFLVQYPRASPVLFSTQKTRLLVYSPSLCPRISKPIGMQRWFVFIFTSNDTTRDCRPNPTGITRIRCFL